MADFDADQEFGKQTFIFSLLFKLGGIIAGLTLDPLYFIFTLPGLVADLISFKPWRLFTRPERYSRGRFALVLWLGSISLGFMLSAVFAGQGLALVDSLASSLFASGPAYISVLVVGAVVTFFSGMMSFLYGRRPGGVFDFFDYQDEKDSEDTNTNAQTTQEHEASLAPPTAPATPTSSARPSLDTSVPVSAPAEIKVSDETSLTDLLKAGRQLGVEFALKENHPSSGLYAKLPETFESDEQVEKWHDIADFLLSKGLLRDTCWGHVSLFSYTPQGTGLNLPKAQAELRSACQNAGILSVKQIPFPPPPPPKPQPVETKKGPSEIKFSEDDAMKVLLELRKNREAAVWVHGNAINVQGTNVSGQHEKLKVYCSTPNKNAGHVVWSASGTLKPEYVSAFQAANQKLRLDDQSSAAKIAVDGAKKLVEEVEKQLLSPIEQEGWECRLVDPKAAHDAGQGVLYITKTKTLFNKDDQTRFIVTTALRTALLPYRVNPADVVSGVFSSENTVGIKVPGAWWANFEREFNGRFAQQKKLEEEGGPSSAALLAQVGGWSGSPTSTSLPPTQVVAAPPEPTDDMSYMMDNGS